MATSASVVIYDDHTSQPLCELYTHEGGYPERFGETLQAFCDRYHIINGVSSSPRPTPGSYANGMGCFAAQLIAHLKTGIGDIYLIPIGQAIGQVYRYHIRSGKTTAAARKLILETEKI